MQTCIAFLYQSYNFRLFDQGFNFFPKQKFTVLFVRSFTIFTDKRRTTRQLTIFSEPYMINRKQRVLNENDLKRTRLSCDGIVGSSPTPCHLSPHQAVSLSQSSCMCVVRGGGGRGAKIKRPEKPWPSANR